MAALGGFLNCGWMFTGLIADLGRVRELERDDEGATIEIATRLARRALEGDSVAVNGVCLTATDVRDGRFARAGDGRDARALLARRARRRLAVNLELALRAERPARRACRAGPRRRHRHRIEVREEGFARVLDIEVDPELGALSGREGLGRGARGQPDRQRVARRTASCR